LQGADLKAFAWLKTSETPALAQFRDDRFTAAFHFKSAGRTKPAEMMMAYVVRAVTPGHYSYPGATVEDMYRPGRFARTAPGTVDVGR
jgi:uncharacterized protein YfaS (alpha-2-macroglobulin family)